MRLTASQALERIQGSGMARKAKGKPMRLLHSVKTSRKERLYVFGHDETAIVAPADDTLPPQLADYPNYANLSDTPRGGNGATQDCFNVYTIDRTNKVVRVSKVGANVSITGERKFMTIAYSE